MVTAPATPAKTSWSPVTVLGLIMIVGFEVGMVVGDAYIGGISVGFSVGADVGFAVGLGVA